MPWFVRHVKRFLNQTRASSLDHLSANTLDTYLTGLVRTQRTTDWQLRQIVDALRLFCGVSRLKWAFDVDWDEWSASAKRLEDDHASRPQPDVETIIEQAGRSPIYKNTPADFAEPIRKLIVAIRLKGFAYTTEKSYCQWVLRFLRANAGRPPSSLSATEVKAFLERLVVRGNVSANTQNQAVCALVFFFNEVVGQPLGDFSDFARSRKPRRLPVVLTTDEVNRVLSNVSGTLGLMVRLMYGTGMRQMECLRLRVQDIDFGHRLLVVRDGKGGKDRRVPLPDSLAEPLSRHLERVKTLHDEDTVAGTGSVWLPDALTRKFPSATREWGWKFVFPSKNLVPDPRNQEIRRHHLHESTLQRAIKKRCPRHRYHQARDIAHAPSFVPDPSAGKRLRHSHRAGIIGPRGCVHDDDLHPRPEQGWTGCGESSGSAGQRAWHTGRTDHLESTGHGNPGGHLIP